MNDLPFVVHCERIGKKQSYFLRFPVNEQLIQRIKELPDDTRKWSGLNYAWEVSTHSLYLLIKKYKGSTKIHFDFGNEDSRKVFIEQIKKIEISEAEKRKFIAELNIKKEHWVKYKEELEKTYEKYSEQVHSFLKPNVQLYPHQIVSSLFMTTVKNTLLALDMGTGKSLAAITACEMNGFEKIIVITPKSLMFNYYNEIHKFTNSSAHIVNWKKNTCGIADSKYVIINYDFFNSSNKEYCNKKWKDLNIKIIDAIILDECQKIKNSNTNIYKNYRRIFNSKIFRNGNRFSAYLSGTPIVNRAKEMYTVLHEISPIDFATKNYFLSYYCGMSYNYETGYGWTVDEADTKFEELFHKISPFVYRKKIEDVIKDLPDKSYQKIILELDDNEQKIYDEIELGAYNEFTKSEERLALTIMLRLRQYTSHNKIKYIYELIDSIIESGEKLVIFDVFKESLIAIHNKYPEISVLHTGDIKFEDRNEAITKFQDKNSDIKLFLSTFSSGNFGLTLTEARKMLLLTLPYSLGEYSQAAARIFRIGQKNNVIIYPLIFQNTIDSYVYELIESKQTEVSKVLDNSDYESKAGESVFGEVIEKIKNKYLK
jgi:SNF2 family DNA or RNA helicase